MPHPAFKAADLDEAIANEEQLLGPYEPIDGFYVAIINDGGVSIDDEVWGERSQGKARFIGATIYLKVSRFRRISSKL